MLLGSGGRGKTTSKGFPGFVQSAFKKATSCLPDLSFTQFPWRESRWGLCSRRWAWELPRHGRAADIIRLYRAQAGNADERCRDDGLDLFALDGQRARLGVCSAAGSELL